MAVATPLVCSNICGTMHRSNGFIPRAWAPGAGRSTPPGTFEDHVKDSGSVGRRRATLSELTSSLSLPACSWFEVSRHLSNKKTPREKTRGV